MYTLQVKAINTIEDEFFDDTKEFDPVAIKTLNDTLRESLNVSFITTMKRYKQDNLYVREVLHSGFKTIEDAERYIIAFADSDHPVRQQIRSWNQQHKILSEFNVLDSNKQIVKVITNCVENVCVRFGGKCDEHNGCSTVSFAHEYKNKKPFPIKVMVG